MAKKAKKDKPAYRIIQKRNGRYAVKNAKGAYINGEEKVKILVAEGKIKLTPPKKKQEEAAAD